MTDSELSAETETDTGTEVKTDSFHSTRLWDASYSQCLSQRAGDLRHQKDIRQSLI